MRSGRAGIGRELAAAQAALALALPHVAEGFVELAVLALLRVAFHRVHHEGDGGEGGLVGVVALVLRGEELVFQGGDGGAGIQARFDLGLELLEAEPGEALFRPQGLPGVQGLGEAEFALTWIIWNGTYVFVVLVGLSAST